VLRVTSADLRSLAAALAPVDPADPTWFPFDVDVAGGRLQWLRVDEGLIVDSAFLDPRMPATGRPQAFTALAPVAALRPPAGAPAWLWHTSFCGSTLLARILHLAPRSVALREPLLLRRLSDAAHAGVEVAPWLHPMTALLSRPWRPDGRVVVKPTHAALNLARAAMAATPEAKALLLTSPLEDFLVSHLKKTADTLAKIPQLAERALRAGGLPQRLPASAWQPPSPLAAAALQWAAQRELVAGLHADCGSRLRVLDWAGLRERIEDGAVEAAAFLQLDLPEAALRAHARACAGVHAKAPARRYDTATLREENDWLRAQHRAAVSDALRWAEAHVLPALSPEALRVDG